MAAFFFLLAIIGGALVGDLVWENTTAGEVTVLDRTIVSYSQGWLLAAAAALGFVVALLLVASVSSTRRRRERRRQLRSLKQHGQHEGVEPELEHASWLDESHGRQETAADAGEPPRHESEPLYEQTRRAARRHDDRRQQWPPDS
jgi:flagellar biosynthesis/type III secretory pathway M-ring protein FliF/YscJ